MTPCLQKLTESFCPIYRVQMLNVMAILFFNFFVRAHAQSNSLNYENLKSLIETKNLKSISEVLPLLPSDYRSEFTLVMKTRSLQDASAQFPRVIMSGLDAKLLMAFNGDPSQKGYDKLELIQFRDDTSRFDFYEIQFPEKNQMGQPINESSSVVFSERNPTKCLSCHTSDPRPNWENYAKWPGVFLGDDDTDNLEKDLPPLTEYQKVMATDFPKHPRYKHLVKLLEGYSNPSSRPSERNINLTHRILAQNFKRVVRLLKTDPYYQAYKYLVIGTFGCFDLKNFSPSNFPTFTARADDFGQTDFFNIFLERRLFTGDLYTNFKSTRPFFTMPDRLEGPLTYYFVKGDPDVESLFTLSSDDSYGMEVPEATEPNCDVLASKSHKALSQILPPVEEVKNRKQPAIIAKCMSCHTSSGLPAPHIAFDNRVRLKAHLQLTSYPHGTFLEEITYRTSNQATAFDRMPPQGISDTDRVALLEYLESVRSQ